jgi:hypothetical protein
MTREQECQTHIDEVVREISGDGDMDYDIEKERECDDINYLLEQISALRESLVETEVNIEDIPVVTSNNSMSEIMKIYKRLKMRNDRNIGRIIVENGILTAVKGLEYLFDGEKEWFGRRYTLKGWSSNVRVHLRRSRYQTSSMLRDVMRDNSISPGMQLGMELITSMFLYSAKKNNISESNNIDQAFRDATSQLNDNMQ